MEHNSPLLKCGPYFPKYTVKRDQRKSNFLFYFILFFCLFAISRAAPVAYGGSQARGLIGAVAAGLHHSHSNAGSLTHWARPEIESATSWFLVGFVSAAPWQELLIFFF